MERKEPVPPARRPGPNALRDHLANERTFLAWMRTVIAIIALGFVVAKFGIVLREESGVIHIKSGTVRLAAIVGVILILGGTGAAILATRRFLQVRTDIEEDIVNFQPGLDIVLAVVVCLLSVILAIFVLVTS